MNMSAESTSVSDCSLLVYSATSGMNNTN